MRRVKHARAILRLTRRVVSRVAHAAQPPAFTLRKTSFGPRSSTTLAIFAVRNLSLSPPLPLPPPLSLSVILAMTFESGSIQLVTTKPTLNQSKRRHRFAVTLLFSLFLSLFFFSFSLFDVV